jgi:hypothetical protein
MKNLLNAVLTLLLVGVIASSAFAEDGKKKEKEKGKDKENNQLLTQTMKRLEKAELTAEQTEKVTGLAKEWQAKFMEVSKKAGLTKEQQEKMATARKAAMDEGKKGSEVKAAVQAAAGLSDEQKQAIEAREKLQADFNKAVDALLTDQQREKIGGKDKQKKKDKKDKQAE